MERPAVAAAAAPFYSPLGDPSQSDEAFKFMPSEEPVDRTATQAAVSMAVARCSPMASAEGLFTKTSCSSSSFVPS
jgi:hypothetical protein